MQTYPGTFLHFCLNHYHSPCLSNHWWKPLYVERTINICSILFFPLATDNLIHCADMVRIVLHVCSHTFYQSLKWKVKFSSLTTGFPSSTPWCQPYSCLLWIILKWWIPIIFSWFLKLLLALVESPCFPIFFHPFLLYSILTEFIKIPDNNF